ncbi:MAG: VOC family protein [Oscillospiraceae bacterium]|nr:VOC family protein [Oscillospiraceae bacterium]
MKLNGSICVKGAHEAVEFYKEAFGLVTAHLGLMPDGTLGHVEFYKDETFIFSMAESDKDSSKALNLILSGDANPVTSFSLDFETEAEIHKAFTVLSKGGRVLSPIEALPWSPCCATVIDKYGVCWYIHVPADKRPTVNEVEEFFGWDK